MLSWSDQFKNKKILLRIDNQALVSSINKRKSKSKYIMQLIRPFVLMTMNNNTQFKALHILGVHNEIADALSRFQMSCSKGGSDSIRYSCVVLDDHFKSEVEFLLLKSVAPSTAKLYNRGLEFYNSFRKDCGLKPVWPVPLQDIVAFIVFMFKSGLAHSMVKKLY
jgi:hypothetical protein